jgi:hypothetical protein
MSLILKEQLANTVPTPPAGKGTLFLNDSGAMQIRQSDGNLASFPTISSGDNTQVMFNDAGSIGQETNFTYNKTSNTLTVSNVTVTGTLSAGDIAVSSIANGTSNVDIVGVSGNVTISVNSVANVLSVTTAGADVVGTLTANGAVGNGIVGGAKTSGSTRGTGVTGQGYVTASGDTGAAVGVRGFSTDTHSGGYNVGVLGNASGSGLGNYAFYVQAGNIASIETATAWDLVDNSAGALLFNSTGKANILGIETTDGAEGIFTSGYLNVTGNVTATRLISNIAVGTAPLTVTSTTRVANLNVATSGIANTVNDAAQGNITSVGTLTSVSVSGNANIGNIGTGGLITATGNITGGNLVTAGDVSATGNVTGNFFIGNGSQLTGLNTNSISNGNSNVSIATANGNVTITAVGNTTMTVTGTGANITGTLSVSGNATVGNIIATNIGNISSINQDGNASNVLHGNGTFRAFTAFSANVNGNGFDLGNVGNIAVTGAISVTGNANIGNIGTTGVVATTLGGTLTTAAQPNITSVGTLTSVSVSGNANVGNIGTGGLITATGNITGGNLVTAGILSVTGTGVSSIAGNLDMTSNTIINLATPTNPTDAATKQYVDDIAQGLHTHDSCNAATTTTLATISGGTVTYNNGTSGVGATLTTTGTYTTIDGVTLSDGMRILVKNEVTAANNGIYVRTSATVLTRADDFDTSVEMAGGDFTFVTAGTQYDNTGWVMTDPVTTVGTSPVIWVQFSGAGTYTAGTGLTLTGSVFSVNVAQPTITSVGTLTSLAVTGNITAGNVSATTFTGSLTGNASGSAATVTTAAQPNITSVGTLTSLAVTGNITAGNVSATTFTGALSGAATTAGTAGTVTTAAQPNVTSVGTLTSLNSSGTITAPAFTANTGVFTGNGSGLSAIAGGNVTGTVSSASSATTAGTVTTAAQPNITSVGTLTALTLSGTLTGAVQIGTGAAIHFGTTLTTGANTTAGTVTGNWALSAGSRWNATYADLSEKYVADADYPPGTVLIFGGDKEVTIANELNTTQVAGVITTDAAYTMNCGLEAEFVADVALQGRVPCKVIGPINKGDLLVSGGNGHAIANNNARAGTIIGKSLHNFTDNIGVIEIAIGRF